MQSTQPGEERIQVNTPITEMVVNSLIANHADGALRRPTLFFVKSHF
jgi:hypothetical protein